MRYCAVVLALLLTALAWPLDQSDVLFYAPFEGNVTPAITLGGQAPKTEGQPTFQAGKRGQAVVCQDKQFSLAYPAAGNLDPQHGSLAIWVSPVGWKHADGKNHNFMTLRGDPTYLLYTYISLPTYFLQLEGPNPNVGADVDWQPGQWHQLVVTWQEGEFCLYVDGKNTGMDTERMALPRQLGEFFDVGSGNFGCEDATAFDDLITFRRALSPQEVKGLFDWTASPEGQAASAPVPNLADVPAVRASLRHFPTAGRVEVTTRATGVGLPGGQALAVKLALVNAAGKALAEQTVSAPLGKAVTSQFSVVKLPAGEYRVVLTPASGKPAELAFSRRAKPAWLGNKLGLDGSVPPPWTPVTVAQKAGATEVGVWGRTLRLGKGLCEQVTTQGQPLLAGPISLRLAEAAATTSPAAVASRTPEAVALSSSGTLGALKLQAKTTCEFDGFTWFDVTLTPPTAGAAVDSLALELPFAKNCASLFYSGVYYPSLDNGTGALPAAGFKGDWRNWFWLGNERGGLEWCAEDHRGWVLTKPKEALSITPGADGTMVRLNIIDAPTKLTAPLKLAFGIQATPVKPQRPDRRLWRVIGQQPGVGLEAAYMLPEDKHIRGVTLWNEGWTETWMLPKPRDWAKESIAQSEAKGVRPCMYLAGTSVDPRDEWFRYYWEDWRVTPGTPYNPAWLDSKDYYIETSVCQASGYQDYFIAELSKALKSAGVTGLYLDNSVPGACSNAFHGCDHRVPVLATRNFYKRLYRLMRAHDPTGFVTIHMSGSPVMAFQAFSDIIIDGENFTGYMQVIKQQKGWDNYWHTLPLDVMRAQYRNHWGPDTAFLPEFGRALGESWNQATPHNLASAEHLIGLFFVHDSGIWPAYSSMEPYGRLFKAQDRFGWDRQIQFVPYWDLRGLASISTTADLSRAQLPEEVRPGNPPLVMSLYRRPGKVMFVPYNNTDQDLAVTIEWDAAKLGVGPVAELEDTYRGTKAKVEGNQVTVTVPKRNFGMWTVP